MATEITSKSELASLTADLNTKSTDLVDSITDLKSDLSDISNYDGIDVSGAASKLISNFSNVSTDYENVMTNIKNYVTQITGFDIDDFDSGATESAELSYEDIFETDGSAEGNARVIWNFLKYKGLSDAAAAGVLGNIQAESGFNPGIEEIANGIGYGLIQWSFGRRTALEAAAAEAGVDPSNLQFQLEYLWSESLDPNTSYGKNLNAAGFYTTESASDAAYYFHKYVEISADSYQAIQNNRCATAEQWYSKFKGTDAGNVAQVSNSDSNSTDWSTIIKTSGATVVTSGVGSGTSSSGYTYSGSSYSGSSYSSSTNNTGTTGSTEIISSLTGIQRSATKPVVITEGDPNVDISKYQNNADLGFEVSVGNTAYELSDADFELLCAIVSAESDKSYDDALAVITTILNRCEDDKWVESYGVDPIAQVTAPEQFVGYQEDAYLSYINGKAPDTVIQAVQDALAGVRSHDYLTYSSNDTTSYSNNMITATGNRYK